INVMTSSAYAFPLLSRHVFLYNATPPTEIYTLSLHDALPISQLLAGEQLHDLQPERVGKCAQDRFTGQRRLTGQHALMRPSRARSEEHTSELQSQSNLVCRLLLEKKKNKKKYIRTA